MPAKSRSTKKKVVASKAKQSNQFAQTLKSIPLFGKIFIAVVLLFGITYGGWYGYGTYKANELKAKAAGWSPYLKTSSAGVWACQYRSNTGAPGVKALGIDNNSKGNMGMEMQLFIGRDFKKDPTKKKEFVGDLKRYDFNGKMSFNGISGVQLSHSEANSFYISTSGAGTYTPLFWSYRISDLAWC